MSRLSAWWRRVSPWARARAADRDRRAAQCALLLVQADLRAERERTLHLTRITHRDQADLESLAEQLGRAWDARDSARRVAVTLDNETRCATDLLRMAHGSLAKLAAEPPECFDRIEQDLHYLIGAFLRTQTTIPGERTEPAKAGA
jgi:hypothetical protein